MVINIEIKIKDYEDYTVDNFGNIRSYKYKEPKILKYKYQKSGYASVCLSKNNKQVYKLVHRIVAEHFIPNPNNLSDVDHINKIRDDNRIENLQWLSHKDNLNKAFKETKSQIRNFCKCILYKDNVKIKEFISISEACKFANEKYGVSISGLKKYKKNKKLNLYIESVETN